MPCRLEPSLFVFHTEQTLRSHNREQAAHQRGMENQAKPSWKETKQEWGRSIEFQVPDEVQLMRILDGNKLRVKHKDEKSKASG